jgi:hypothetical protein
MTVGCVPALITAGCIEAFISPSHAPVWFKAALGLVLGVVFWLYLLGRGRGIAPADVGTTRGSQ